jgi:hypothetical protein
VEAPAGSPPVPASALGTQTLVHGPPALIGREPELAQVFDVLAQRTSALILVPGEPGMGKSAFMRELNARAAAQGWAVAGSDASGELTITPSTTPPEFGRRLRDLLGLPAPAGLTATRLAGAEVGERATRSTDPAGQTALAGEGGFIAKVLEGVKRWLSEASWLNLKELVQDIASRAPVLLLIDGYSPNKTFERSFALAFLPALRRRAEPVVVVLVEREQQLSGLAASATAVIPVGPVDERPIRQHLEGLATCVVPPLTEAELEEYAVAAADSPELIGSLTRLLALMCPERQ